MIVDPARPAEIAPALQWLFGHLPPEDCRQRTNAALSLLEPSADATSQLLIARDAKRVVGASLMQVLVGATGVIWPPRGERLEIEDLLTRQSVGWLIARGANSCKPFFHRMKRSLLSPFCDAVFSIRPAFVI